MKECCQNCKNKGNAAVYDVDWNVRKIECKKKRSFKFLNDRCEDYEPNLHVNNAARTDPQTRDNGVHQEE